MAGPHMLLRGGRKVDLSNLRPGDIDFRAVAETMAHIVRYNAALDLSCSDAEHTIIACLCAPEAVRPYVVAHDLQEFIFGDLTSPIRDLLEYTALRDYGKLARMVIASVIGTAKSDLDRVIFDAAGLTFPMPEWVQKEVKKADIRAMATEILVFNGGVYGGPEGWPPGIEQIPVLSPLPKPMSPEKAARELMALMERYLPVFNPLSRTA